LKNAHELPIRTRDSTWARHKTNTTHREGAKSAKEFIGDFGTNPIVRAPAGPLQYEFVLNFFALFAPSR